MKKAFTESYTDLCFVMTRRIISDYHKYGKTDKLTRLQITLLANEIRDMKRVRPVDIFRRRIHLARIGRFIRLRRTLISLYLIYQTPNLINKKTEERIKDYE